MMQVKLFTIPVIGGEKLTEELNAFLRSRKVLQTESHMINNSQGVYWCFCIKYLESGAATPSAQRKDKPDYKALLDEISFQRFSAFRKIRKAISNDEAIPAYAVFSDAELAEIAKLGKEFTLADIRKIRGIGKKKVEKYGHYFIDTKSEDEAS